MNPLRVWRAERGITIKRVMARVSYATKETIYNWEAGRTKPTFAAVDELMQGYQMDEREAVMMVYKCENGRPPEGEVEDGINAYSLSNWKGTKTYAQLGGAEHVGKLGNWCVGKSRVTGKDLRSFAEALGKSEASVAVASYKAWKHARK